MKLIDKDVYTARRVVEYEEEHKYYLEYKKIVKLDEEIDTRFGIEGLKLTDEDIAHLINGKCIYFDENAGEYALVIYYGANDEIVGDYVKGTEPTIDAIPIDWIRKEQNKLLKSNDIENIKRAEWLNGMVYRWRKDNE